MPAKKKQAGALKAKKTVEPSSPAETEPVQQAEPVSRKSKRMSTGVKSLDSNLSGGYPVPSVILVEGKPGSGKSSLCMAFASDALKNGKSCLYICTNNYAEEVKKAAKSIGYDIDGATFIDAYGWLVGKKGNQAVSTIDLTGFLEKMENLLKEEETEAVVLDSLSSLFLYNEDRKVEQFVQAFGALVKGDVDCALIAVETGTYDSKMGAVLEYLTDGILVLGQNDLKIEKMANTSPKHKELRMDIASSGITFKEKE